MPAVATSISLPLAVWERTRELKINRSAISRRAIEAEIERVEKETGVHAAKQNSPAVNSMRGGQYEG